jgi:hypothetical protein
MYYSVIDPNAELSRDHKHGISLFGVVTSLTFTIQLSCTTSGVEMAAKFTIHTKEKQRAFRFLSLAEASDAVLVNSSGPVTN